MTWTSKSSAIMQAANANPSIVRTGVGNLVVCIVINTSASGVLPTALSGGGCNWTMVPSHTTSDPTTIGIFLGTVTSTGTSVATITWGGATPASWNADAWEY